MLGNRGLQGKVHRFTVLVILSRFSFLHSLIGSDIKQVIAYTDLQIKTSHQNLGKGDSHWAIQVSGFAMSLRPVTVTSVAKIWDVPKFTRWENQATHIIDRPDE